MTSKPEQYGKNIFFCKALTIFFTGDKKIFNSHGVGKRFRLTQFKSELQYEYTINNFGEKALTNTIFKCQGKIRTIYLTWPKALVYTIEMLAIRSTI
jgi:hypothetical protein